MDSVVNSGMYAISWSGGAGRSRARDKRSRKARHHLLGGSAQAPLGVIPTPFLLRVVNMQAGLWSAAIVFRSLAIWKGASTPVVEPQASHNTMGD
jgi:hypothetical protein